MWEFLASIIPGGSTAWTLDVWDCRGTLKPTALGLGYGCRPELPDGWEWYELEWFTIPVPKGTELTREQGEEIAEVLWKVLDRRGGAINMSGWYPAFEEDIEQISAVIGCDLSTLLEVGEET